MQFSVENAAQTRELGERLAGLLKAGDLVLLSGGLGAGKTTFTQGIGKGLGVRGQIASPTFIIARVHPPETGTLALIHADAYRITSLQDLETLDLESSLAEAVTVVEWGRGKIEELAASRLEIEIERVAGEFNPTGQIIDLADLDDGHRLITISGIGPRWADLEQQL